MTAKEHNRLAGIFLMAHGGMQAVVMLIMGVIYGIMGVVMISNAGRQGEARFVGIAFIIVVAVLALFAIFFCGSQILGGYKLFKERPNARTWGIIGSIVSCLSFPLGTAAGVYGLWFLFGDMGKQMYMNPGMSQPMLNQTPQFDYQQQQYQQPPPPNSWK